MTNNSLDERILLIFWNLIAAQNGHVETINLLIKHDADVNVKDKNGDNILMKMRKEKNKNLYKVRPLIYKYATKVQVIILFL